MSNSDPGEISAWTVADVARALRRARTTQGLRVDEVAQGAGVPANELRALESAALDRFPDSLSALRATRRSADYLGLPGDQLALALMERWPLRGRRAPASSDPTSVVPAVGGATAAVDAESPTMVPGGRWNGASREALFGAGATAGGTSEVVLDQVSRAVADGADDTRSVPVQRAPGYHEELGDAPPTWLRALVVVAVVAVLAVVAGLVVHGLAQRNSANKGSSANRAGTSSTRKAGSKGHATDQTVSFTSAPTSATSALITVGAPSFTVTVSAVGGAAWVQVTAPTHQGPLYAHVLQPGQNQSFSVHHALTVEVGSVAGHATVTVGSTRVGSYAPPAAPFHMTFKPGT